MRATVERFYLSLAASDLTRAELRKFALRIEKDGPDAFVRAITELRNMAHVSHTEREFRAGGRESGKSHRLRPTRSRRDDDVTLKAVSMLRDESQLSVARAGEMLRPMLKEHGGENFEDYMPRHRESFTRWIDRVRKLVPGSTLLHEITRVRNSILHSNQDWPLRHRED